MQIDTNYVLMDAQPFNNNIYSKMSNYLKYTQFCLYFLCKGCKYVSSYLTFGHFWDWQKLITCGFGNYTELLRGESIYAINYCQASGIVSCEEWWVAGF